MGFLLLTRTYPREKGEAFLARKMSVGMVRIIVVSGEYRLFADLATCYVNAIKRYAIEGKRFRRPAGMGARLWAVKVCIAAQAKKCITTSLYTWRSCRLKRGGRCTCLSPIAHRAGGDGRQLCRLGAYCSGRSLESDH